MTDKVLHLSLLTCLAGPQAKTDRQRWSDSDKEKKVLRSLAAGKTNNIGEQRTVEAEEQRA